VNEDARRERISIGWSPEARSELRAINRETAMQIRNCIDRYVADRAGDVKKLKPPITGLRLRCGVFRVFFDHSIANTVAITSVRNRRQAYR
jgi:mRNA-degrading endonuclease RelE of RelBE toxin-antitoxin system